MREMRWSWSEYEGTPVYVRQFCWDFVMRQRRVENSRRQEPPVEPGKIRVKR